jgi:hypothetical protein
MISPNARSNVFVCSVRANIITLLASGLISPENDEHKPDLPY